MIKIIKCIFFIISIAILLYLTLIANNIAFVKIVDEFGIYYVPFEKKVRNSRILYYNLVGERDFSDLNDDELLELEEFCNMDKNPDFLCGKDINLEINRRNSR